MFVQITFISMHKYGTDPKKVLVAVAAAQAQIQTHTKHKLYKTVNRKRQEWKTELENKSMVVQEVISSVPFLR